MNRPPLLVTNALPYANGSLHIGHLVEHVQADAYVRFQRMTGRDVIFVSAADTHGAPIEMKAASQARSPSLMVEEFRKEHIRDCQGFGISHDIYGTTNSPENKQYAEQVYWALKDGGHVVERDVPQLYCDRCERFLADRFIRGTCPNCQARNQYGDGCEKCGKQYRPVELTDPQCATCKNRPVTKVTRQLFVKLQDFTNTISLFSARLQPEVRNFVSGWLESGLRDWEISRDAPYFGFPIPGSPGKFFYVWMDAPLGYISATAQLCRERGVDLSHYWGACRVPYEPFVHPRGDWQAMRQGEIVHFIGKDIIYFHSLFWPAMLEAAGFQLPTKIHVHGMLNFGGQKMAKSRGQMITERAWLRRFDPSYLRYYLAANIGPGIDDIEFSIEELRNRVNAGLINNIGNLAQRSLSFLATRFDGILARSSDASPASFGLRFGEQVTWVTAAEQAYEDMDCREAVRRIEQLASWANETFHAAAPWSTIKTDSPKAHVDVSFIVNVVKVLAGLLTPIVPAFADDLRVQLNCLMEPWDDCVRLNLPAGHRIGTPRPMLKPLELADLQQLFGPEAS